MDIEAPCGHEGVGTCCEASFQLQLRWVRMCGERLVACVVDGVDGGRKVVRKYRCLCAYLS